MATLVKVVEGAEKAYPWEMLSIVVHAESFDYLARLDEEQLLTYGRSIEKLRDNLAEVTNEMGNKEKAAKLLTCLDNVLKDVANPPTYPEEVQRRRGTIPAKRPNKKK